VSVLSPQRGDTALALPDLDGWSVPGGRLADRAVRLALALIGVLGATAIVAASTVRVRILVDGAGFIEPAVLWAVRAPTTALVDRVLVTTGETVRAGQPLLSLDAADADAQVRALDAQARAAMMDREQLARSLPLDLAQRRLAVTQAETRVMKARAALRERLVAFGFGDNVDSTLRTYRAGAHVDLDLAVGDLTAALSDRDAAVMQRDRAPIDDLQLAEKDADLRRLHVELDAARARVARLVITAPAPGIVSTAGVDTLTGRLLRAGETVMELSGPGRWRVVMEVPEAAIRRVRVGDTARVTIAALSGTRTGPLVAHIASISTEPTRLGSRVAGTYAVVAEIDSAAVNVVASGDLRRGYAARAAIVTGSERIVDRVWHRLKRRDDGGGSPPTP
jgi:multidrug resistance efflux pump